MSSQIIIAKNSIMLYVRMFISVMVGLYTSRVVLQTLGVEDYGVYGIVGGVISMLGFLNTSMSSATSRFITFELVRDDLQKIRETFSTALLVHVGIALIVVILSETAGYWFLCHKLVIPPDRMYAAHWVFHCSVLSTAVSITQTPYTAVIMSHEKMDIYAYFELLNVLLKLLIVYLLSIGNFDKLILYSVLTLMESFVMAMIYRVYCLNNYKESHFRLVWNRAMLQSIFSFSGWNFIDNFSNTFRQQGISYLINFFFGVVYNAANGVANVVFGIIFAFSFNILHAFRPQIIKQYSLANFNECIALIYRAASISGLMFALLAIPMIAEMNYLMHLWLEEVPDKAVVFCQLMLVAGCIDIYGSAVYIGFVACGRMRVLTCLIGLCFFLTVPLVWLALVLTNCIETTYIVPIGISIVSLSIRIILIRKYIGEFCVNTFLKGVLTPNIVICLLISLIVLVMTTIFEDSFLRCSLVCAISLLLGVGLGYCFILNRQQRQIIFSYIYRMISDRRE